MIPAFGAEVNVFSSALRRTAQRIVGLHLVTAVEGLVVSMTPAVEFVLPLEHPRSALGELSQPPRDAMVIATPFKENEHAFYYNAKLNCMTAEGYFDVGGKRYEFDKKKALGTLDWGRGVWTYKNVWYWGSMQHRLDNGHTIGFNLGYGFGDNSQASENMFFTDGIAHKLGSVTFDIPQKDGKDDFMKEWAIRDDEDRLFMRFKPMIDRYDAVNALAVSTCQHQVFGEFTGYVRLEDGSLLEFGPCRGFAEKVVNKW